MKHLLSSPRSVPSACLRFVDKENLSKALRDASPDMPVECEINPYEVGCDCEINRHLLLQQSDAEYPAAAKGQQGSVVLQVLIDRDGTVQDAKFLQGSLAFARAATDAVKQWHFKPYVMNGRPVSTRTVLTLTFKPTP
jgi:periplasmic protein TonB